MSENQGRGPGQQELAERWRVAGRRLRNLSEEAFVLRLRAVERLIATSNRRAEINSRRQ